MSQWRADGRGEREVVRQRHVILLTESRLTLHHPVPRCRVTPHRPCGLDISGCDIGPNGHQDAGTLH